MSKSEFFPITPASCRDSSSIPFRVVREGFKYLGVQVTRSFNNLFKANFCPLLDRCKNDFVKWSSLPLSLAGRTNLIKMSVLPRFLYLFSNIPVFIRKNFFTKLDSLITSFLWGNKTPRIRKTFLQRLKCQGGMALPNLLFYYWASNVQKIIFWLSSVVPQNTPLWVEMEQSCANFKLSSLICSSLPLMGKNYFSAPNPVLTHTLKIWAQFRRHFGLQSASILGPMVSNCLFPPSYVDSAFCVWEERGIRLLRDLYFDNTFCSFEELARKFALPRSHFFRFLQIRSFIKKVFAPFPGIPPTSPMDTLLDLKPHSRGLISSIYSIITSIDPQSLDDICKAWQSDLRREITDGEWEDALNQVHSSSPCARHGLVQFKVLHRLHFTNSRLAKIYPNVSPACNRCSQSPATTAHMFWLCPGLEEFWRGIFESYTNMYGIQIDPDPLVCIFGAAPEGIELRKDIRSVIAFTTLLARRLILFQ